MSLIPNLSKGEENSLLIKKEDKFFEKSEDMSEVIYPNERELVKDAHSCEDKMCNF